MAYIQKSRKELLTNIGYQSQALGRQSQTGQEIINNQKQLEQNKAQQNLEMNSYVNQFRNQMGLTQRATVKAQAQGGTGGSALYNQQQATNSLGQDLAKTQANYQQFTRDANEQNKEYNESLDTLGNQAKGEVAEQGLSEELSENQKQANESAKTAANVALGVNIAATAVQFIPVIGQIAGLAIKGVGALVSGVASGTAAAMQAKAGGADTSGAIKAGFLSGGLNAATSAFSMGGTGNAAGKLISSTTGKISGEVAKNVSTVGKEVLVKTGKEVGEKTAEEIGKTAAKDIVGGAVKTATQKEIISTPTELLTQDILKDKKFAKSIKTLSKKLGITGEEYGEKVTSVISEKALAIQEKAAGTAIDRGLMPNTPEFNKFVSNALKQNKTGLQAQSMQMLKADYETVAKETLTGITGKLKGNVLGKGKVKFSRLDRLKSGEIGKTKFITNTMTRAGIGAGASYLGTQAITTGATRNSTNAKSKEKYGSIFDEIGRPDLRQKYGF